MARYSIAFKPSVRNDLRDVPKADVERILHRIGALADDPRPRDREKLSQQERYRVRQGDHPIVCEVKDAQVLVWVVRVGHRRDVYRR